MGRQVMQRPTSLPPSCGENYYRRPLVYTLCASLTWHAIGSEGAACLFRASPPKTVVCNLVELALPHNDTPDTSHMPPLTNLTTITSSATSSTLSFTGVATR